MTPASRIIVQAMLWQERSTAALAMKKYPKAFIHFINVNKLGINPGNR